MQNLPEFYVADGGTQVGGPVYALLADCYLDDTLWLTGEHIEHPGVPNHHMQPLNQAAGERVEAWLASLPLEGKAYDVADLTEAAVMLRPREGEKELSHEQFTVAVLRLASELKAKRTGNQPHIPGMQTRAASPKAAPPMQNAMLADPRGYENNRGGIVHHQQRPQGKIKRQVPAAGNLPPAGSPQG